MTDKIDRRKIRKVHAPARKGTISIAKVRAAVKAVKKETRQ